MKSKGVTSDILPKYFSVKESVFPFATFPGVDPLLGPELRSTGEVMGTGKHFGEAFNKALLAAGMTVPRSGTTFISDRKSVGEGRRVSVRVDLCVRRSLKQKHTLYMTLQVMLH